MVVVNSGNPGTLEVESEGSEIQDCVWLYNTVETSLGYIRCDLKANKQLPPEKLIWVKKRLVKTQFIIDLGGGHKSSL